MDDSDDLGLDAVFIDTPRPPSPDPTVAIYTREGSSVESDWKDVEIRLVGSHPLWGHYLWNAARAFASYLDSNPELYRDRFVLELGAGGGLPGIVAAKNGAQRVLLTDYPDAELIRNMEYNINRNIPAGLIQCISAQGHLWGQDIHRLLQPLPAGSNGYHLLILSDLVFNHSQHDALLKTCELSLAPLLPSTMHDSPVPAVLVFYTHHRPHLAHRDMVFFEKARERGWKCEEILSRKFPPMFPDDPGEEEVRSTVHGWKLTRQTR